ncbi:hypothetical protein QF038_001897 [Pseudarthrobacter sp. W1I19]|nr:hypothetical protein [Pseudarthrobacter sp. W1I19]
MPFRWVSIRAITASSSRSTTATKSSFEPYTQKIHFAAPATNPYCKPSAADSAIDRNPRI